MGKKEEVAIIPLDVIEIQKRYKPLIMAIVSSILKKHGEAAFEEAYDLVIQEIIRKKEIPVTHGEAGVRAFLRKLATWRSFDVGRKYSKMKIKRGQILGRDYDAGEFTAFEIPTARGRGRKARHKLRNDSNALLDAVQFRNIKVVNIDIFEDYCLGMTRKDVARKHGLTDLQIKWRLAYTRKRLQEELKKAKRREKLRQFL